MRNLELQTIDFMYRFNKICLWILIIISIILMIVSKEVGFGIGIILILIGIINYYFMKFIIEWAENTFFIRKSNDELVELIKKQIELLSGKINE